MISIVIKKQKYEKKVFFIDESDVGKGQAIAIDNCHVMSVHTYIQKYIYKYINAKKKNR